MQRSQQCWREKEKEKHKLAQVYIFTLHTNNRQYINSIVHFLFKLTRKRFCSLVVY